MIVVAHEPSPHLAQCELTHIQRQRIDRDLAGVQHAAFCQSLLAAGVDVRVFDFNRSFPDCAFVEDVAVRLDDGFLASSLGAPSRQAETEAWLPVLREFGELYFLPPDARLDGGDVLVLDRTIVLGRSTRSNPAAAKALEKIGRRRGYRVCQVPVDGCLHLKTACTALDDTTLLINPRWIDTRRLPSARYIAAIEPWGANVLRLPDRLLANQQCPRTIDRLLGLGYRVEPIDISEFSKAEAGLTCLSLCVQS